MKKTLCNGLSLLLLGTLALVFVSCELGGTIEWPSCSIVYNSNNGSGETANSKHNYGSSFNLSANQFDRTGYTFLGWADSPTGTITYLDQEAMDKESVGTKTRITLYAQWMANAYTIAFDSNGGTGTMPDKDLQYDEEWTLDQNTFINGDNLFLGWALSESGAILYDDEELIKNLSAVDGDTVTLYARWSHQELFVSSTDDSTANDEATLGLIGTRAESSDESVATVNIENGKINITSVSVGNAVITVFDSSQNEATIDVTVEETGTIIIGNIVKHIANSVSSLDALREKLDSIISTSASKPEKIKLDAINISSVWGEINDIVMNAQKHIILDLSNCTANQNAITGRSSPSGNDMNVIQYNEYMKGIILPSTLTAIGNNTFYNCNYLSSVTIPSNVITVGSSAFYACYGLTSVTFETSGLDITSAAFDDFTNAIRLTSAYEAEGAGTYTRDGRSSDWIKEGGVIAMLIEDLNALTSTSADNPVAVKLEVGRISSLWKKIHDTVQAAQKHVVLDLSDCTFTGNTITGSEYPSSNLMNIIRDNEYIKGIILPSTLETIGDNAFYDCFYLTKITIPASVSSIGRNAFYECTELVAVTFEGSEVAIDASASFPGNLREAYIAEGEGNYTRAAGSNSWVKEGGLIADLTEELASLSETSVDNPATIKLATNNISDLWGRINTTIQSANKYIILDLFDCTVGGNTIIGSDSPSGNDMNIIKANEYIKGIILPSNLESIGNNAFKDCVYLSAVTIPDGVTSIGTGAFENCSALTSIIIPESVTEIKDWAFYSCSNLTSVTFKRTDIEIGSDAFPGNLSTLYITEGGGIYTRTAQENWVKQSGMADFYIEDLQKQLADISFTSESSPETIRLKPTVFTNVDSIVGDIVAWGNINDTVQDAGKYVILDLSDLTAEENTITGRMQTPSGNDMNIIKDNQYIKGIILPSSLTTIGDFAFDNCANLEGIILPAGVTSRYYYVFSGCTSLKSITIPDNTTSIGMGAFYQCYSLTNVIIPADVTSIANDAFLHCDNLTSVTFKSNGITIGGRAFASTNNESSNSLRDVYTIDGVGTYIRTAEQDDWRKSINSPLLDAIKTQLEALTDTSMDTPALLKLAPLTFSTAASVPEGMIGWREINTAVKNSRKYVLLDLSDCTIDRNTTDGMGIIADNEYIKGLILPSSLKRIGNYAFENCSYLTSINIPEGVTYIGYGAFQACSNLTNMTIPDSITTIDSRAFGQCNGLKTIIIGKGVTFMGSLSGAKSLIDIIVDNANTRYASESGVLFDKAKTTLIEYPAGKTETSYTIPDSVTSIGSSAFSGCTGLENIIIANNVTYIGDYAFSGCNELTSITIPDSVTSIGSYAFSDCSGLTSVTIPDSVTSIGMYAFLRCSGLTSITIPDSVTSIEHYAFAGCSGLTSVTISDSVTSIRSSTFSGCSGLTSVTIPDSVTLIEFDAFSGCSGLTNVTIPDSVTSIGSDAFSGCSELVSVTFKGSGLAIAISSTFPGNLSTAYSSGGAGTYTRTAGQDNWVKQ
jgi:uncharacterized repeat protein (TIGR02543 family)